MTVPRQIAEGQSYPYTPHNENMTALGQAFVWAHDSEADTGTTVGYGGGTFAGNAVAAGTLSCTDNTTNYVVVNRSTRVASTSTSTTNWNNTATYGRAARAVFASGVLTWHDERHSPGGIFDHGASSAPVISVNGATGAVTLDAGDIGITDAGGYYTGTEVETALQEVGAALGSVGGSSHARSHAMTGTSDHTAGNWKVFHSNGSGQVAELALGSAGTFLRSAGASSAPTMAAVAVADLPAGALVSVAAFFYPGAPTASALVGQFAAPAGTGTLTFAASLSGSSGIALTAATAQTDIDVRKNAATSSGGTSVGTIRWAAAGTVPSFISSGFTLTGGTDYLTFWGPGTPDATLANLSASLYATRSA